MNLYKTSDQVISSEYIYTELASEINIGDTLYLEIDTMSFGGIYDVDVNRKDFLHEILSIFRKLVGNEGNIICPAFSYSWGDNSKNKVFNIKKTRSKVGIFPEFFRKLDNVDRTNDPMFSYLIQGPKSSYYSDISNNSFGVDSLFDKLLKDNAKLMSFGLGQYDPTFVHFVEQHYDENIKKIGYRFLKTMKGTFEDESSSTEAEFFTFLRQEGSKYIFSEENLVRELRTINKLCSKQIGNSVVHISDTTSVFDVGIEGLKSNPHFFIREQ
jgi:aminoglycoside 3-N-acetyltransferase